MHVTIFISPVKSHNSYINVLNTLEVMLDIDMLMKFAPASVATALASIVFPVPGGPNKSIPLQGCMRERFKSYFRINKKNYAN